MDNLTLRKIDLIEKQLKYVKIKKEKTINGLKPIFEVIHTAKKNITTEKRQLSRKTTSIVVTPSTMVL